MLVLMRSVATGGGEAFFGPANYSLLAQYHDKTRAFAMSVHQTAYYIGIIISGYAAGYIGQLWGWRSAFYIFGAIGVVHGIVMAVRLKDKKEPAAVAAAEAAEPKPRLMEGFRMVFTTPTALILTVCFAGLIFVLTGYLTWDADLSLREFRHGPRGRRISLDVLHPPVRLCRRAVGRTPFGQAREPHPAWRMAMQGFGLLAAVPFIVLMGNSATLWVIYIGFAGFGFARAFFDANTYTVLTTSSRPDITPRLRA